VPLAAGLRLWDFGPQEGRGKIEEGRWKKKKKKKIVAQSRVARDCDPARLKIHKK
jgi:hypothetical protein